MLKNRLYLRWSGSKHMRNGNSMLLNDSSQMFESQSVGAEVENEI